jgi:hypothetical protein
MHNAKLRIYKTSIITGVEFTVSMSLIAAVCVDKRSVVEAAKMTFILRERSNDVNNHCCPEDRQRLQSCSVATSSPIRRQCAITQPVAQTTSSITHCVCPSSDQRSIIADQ